VAASISAAQAPAIHLIASPPNPEGAASGYFGASFKMRPGELSVST
jgi:hypothetical protein